MDHQDSSRSAPVIPSRPRQTRSNVCTECRRQKQKVGMTLILVSSPIALPAASPATIAGRTAANATATQPSPAPATVGRLWNSRGAPTYHGDSYFGHQAAADMMHVESPQLPVGMNGIRARRHRQSSHAKAYRSEKGVYAHVWELVGYLPRQKPVVDNLLNQFLIELNPIYDSLHEETFLVKYEAFWNRKWSDDDSTAIDLRWLALLFIVIAFGELLDSPSNASPEAQADCEETSLRFYWASRTAMTMAMTFSGESPDAIRAGILQTRYLVYLGRKTESWLTCGFSVRFAQAQGMHIDGESWRLPPKVLETRRRLWCAAYALDRFVSLALGRPAATNDRTCMEMRIRNIWIDDKPDEEASVAVEQPEEDPTPSVYYLYQQKLATIVGRIHDECFGLAPLTASYSTYEKVLDLDRLLVDWAALLPTYFRLEDSDKSLDHVRPFLYWQRMYLHSAFHFARVTLHRTYVLLESITDRFQTSEPIRGNLKLKLSFHNLTMADRLRAGAAMHNSYIRERIANPGVVVFSSALVLGIIAVRDPFSLRTSGILQDLTAYCEKQNLDSWANEFVLAEVRVVELCIASARKSRQDAGLSERRPRPISRATGDTQQVNGAERLVPAESETGESYDMLQGSMTAAPAQEITDDWLENWFGPSRNFPEPGDYQLWENLVGTLEAR
ncbi:putative Nucleus protein [Seiridium cardinale]|uniref:Nucleus protein n=1 Tax=Seiridium cardinale TaxID=138064 RepID=A0ABR2XYM5_9PEZI